MNALKVLMTAVRATSLSYRLITTSILIGQVLIVLSTSTKKKFKKRE